MGCRSLSDQNLEAGSAACRRTQWKIQCVTGLVVRQTTALNDRENGSNSAGEAAANDRWTIEVKNFRGRSIGRLSSEVLPSQGERQW